jgi:cell cycle checkpoint protein
MDSSLHEVWLAAKGNEFVPKVGKDSQFVIGFFLLILGISITGAFALSELSRTFSGSLADLEVVELTVSLLDRSFLNIPLLGVPASLAIACVRPWNRPLSLPKYHQIS